MTRAKTSPSIHKPVFDAEGILRFAASASRPAGSDSLPDRKEAKRTPLTLRLKNEIVDYLQAEAARKGKTVEQVVEKLVNKQLNKH